MFESAYTFIKHCFLSHFYKYLIIIGKICFHQGSAHDSDEIPTWGTGRSNWNRGKIYTLKMALVVYEYQAII